jgi:5-oxopent-3-ene-1,2,5-tricarboxylate decarboxylase / 2-hydroxyhepta-2,4-diene-1,7-dioate isomerase
MLRLPFDTAPYALSGVVYGALLNDPGQLIELGLAAEQPPYKGAPKAPVLALKARGALQAAPATVRMEGDARQLLLHAQVGLVVGQTACRVSRESALEHVAGMLLVAEFTEPLANLAASHYRPAVRQRNRDGSCLLGPVGTAAGSPDRQRVDVLIDGQTVHQFTTTGLVRSAAQLLADVTEFMTLQPGDVLLMGSRGIAPALRRGQRFALTSSTLGRLEGDVA